MTNAKGSPVIGITFNVRPDLLPGSSGYQTLPGSASILIPGAMAQLCNASAASIRLAAVVEFPLLFILLFCS